MDIKKIKDIWQKACIMPLPIMEGNSKPGKTFLKPVDLTTTIEDLQNPAAVNTAMLGGLLEAYTLLLGRPFKIKRADGVIIDSTKIQYFQCYLADDPESSLVDSVFHKVEDPASIADFNAQAVGSAVIASISRHLKHYPSRVKKYSARVTAYFGGLSYYNQNLLNALEFTLELPAFARVSPSDKRDIVTRVGNAMSDDVAKLKPNDIFMACKSSKLSSGLVTTLLRELTKAGVV